MLRLAFLIYLVQTLSPPVPYLVMLPVKQEPDIDDDVIFQGFGDVNTLITVTVEAEASVSHEVFKLAQSLF
jgi:hypothetical protein